jgi:hypothetical protein
VRLCWVVSVSPVEADGSPMSEQRRRELVDAVLTGTGFREDREDAVVIFQFGPERGRAQLSRAAPFPLPARRAA